MATRAEEEELVRLMAEVSQDPDSYMKIAYPWMTEKTSMSGGPRAWQRKVNMMIRDHLKDPATRFQPLRIAIASGHDIGKSAEISMIIDWAISTCADCKVVATANTEVQLRTKTWPEVAKWRRMSLTDHWFNTTATAISSRDPKRERTWRADAVSWSEENTEAFAGLHNKGKRILVVFDEASAISDLIWEVTEGALLDEDTEIIWLAFGNPTRNTGRFRECFGRFKHRWKHMQIDSRNVEGTNKEEIARWISDYGEDSDFVRVRVKGEFPRAGNMQFISGDLVEIARKREPYAKVIDARIMGVDVARYGDDESVIAFRCGRDAASYRWLTFRGLDIMTLSARIIEEANLFKPDMIFVDEGGVGGGVVDRLISLNMNCIGVMFGASSDRGNADRDHMVVYANKRAEMWGTMRDWLKGGSIPDDPDLSSQLVGVEYGYVMRNGSDAILLEKKSDMKKRGLASPDRADALALTFAYPVGMTDHTSVLRKGGNMHRSDYNPLDPQRIRAGS